MCIEYEDYFGYNLPLPFPCPPPLDPDGTGWPPALPVSLQYITSKPKEPNGKAQLPGNFQPEGNI